MSSANAAFPQPSTRKDSVEKLVMRCSVAAETRENHAEPSFNSHKTSCPIEELSAHDSLPGILAATGGSRRSGRAPHGRLVEDKAQDCAQLIKPCQAPQMKVSPRQRFWLTAEHESKFPLGILVFVMESVTNSLKGTCSLVKSLGFLYIIQLPSCLLKIWCLTVDWDSPNVSET